MTNRYKIALTLLTVFTVFRASNAFTQTADTTVALSARPLSLQECIDYALQNSNKIKSAFLDVKIAEARSREFIALGLPQINGSAGFVNNYKVPVSFIPAQFFDPNATGFAPVKFQPRYGAEAGIEASQLIVDGSYFIGLRAAKVYKELATTDLTRNKIELTEAVTKAYYSTLVSREGLALIQKNVDRLDTLLAETEKIYKNGFVEKLDVDRIRVARNNLLVERQRSENMTALSIYFLKNTIGMDINEEIILTDRLADIELSGPISDENFDYRERIEYKNLSVQKRLTEYDVKNNTYNYFPSLSAFFSIGANSASDNLRDIGNFGDKWFGNGAFGFRLTVPIFDGLRKSNKIQQLKLNIQKIDYGFEDLRRGIQLQLKQTALNYAAALRQAETRKQNLELAQDVARVAKIKYEQGVGSNLEVITAETELREAQTNYYAALYDALIAKVERERALGILVKE